MEACKGPVVRFLRSRNDEVHVKWLNYPTLIMIGIEGGDVNLFVWTGTDVLLVEMSMICEFEDISRNLIAIPQKTPSPIW